MSWATDIRVVIGIGTVITLKKFDILNFFFLNTELIIYYIKSDFGTTYSVKSCSFNKFDTIKKLTVFSMIGIFFISLQ
jgi:hypothetical protein